MDAPSIETIYICLNIIVGIICAYIPFACYMDWKYREFDPRYWVPLVVIATPITAWLYLTDVYPWYSLIVSAILCLIFWFAMRGGYLEGADFLFLCFISVFWVINPFPYTHGIMQIPFYIYFAFTTIVALMYVFVYNISKGNRWGIVDMMCKYPRGFPYMIPISAAFLMSVVLG